MRPTDQMLARLAAESEEKQSFIDGVVEDAEKNGRDLTEQEMELATRARDRLAVLGGQIETLKETRRIGVESAEKIAELAPYMRPEAVPAQVEYRSAGEYICD